MKYLVMECHRSYAIVLDEKGRFLKVPNLNYEVGALVDEVIEFSDSKKRSLFQRKAILMAIAAAACICLTFLGSFRILYTPFGTVKMQINPNVKMSVNRLNYIIDLEGLNRDGEKLIENIDIHGKKVDDLSQELADQAIAMGYLEENGKITLTIDSQNKRWKAATQTLLTEKLNTHFKNSISIFTNASSAKETDQTEDMTSYPSVVISVFLKGIDAYFSNEVLIPEAQTNLPVQPSNEVPKNNTVSGNPNNTTIDTSTSDDDESNDTDDKDNSDDDSNEDSDDSDDDLDDDSNDDLDDDLDDDSDNDSNDDLDDDSDNDSNDDLDDDLDNDSDDDLDDDLEN